MPRLFCYFDHTAQGKSFVFWMVLSPKHASGSLRNAAQRGDLLRGSYLIREATQIRLRTAKNGQKRLAPLKALSEAA